MSLRNKKKPLGSHLHHQRALVIVECEFAAICRQLHQLQSAPWPAPAHTFDNTSIILNIISGLINSANVPYLWKDSV